MIKIITVGVEMKEKYFFNSMKRLIKECIINRPNYNSLTIDDFLCER